ncbi:hypothetical protein [Saccharopolyspora antimicrobica]|uniref:hypothetical protein n=1 Tax=Saccharopolyspora antimicrobica TaxID=455193 RepID=UPI000B86E75C|nr:hypothetical protein [Saccharopolyspora antimicrobica]
MAMLFAGGCFGPAIEPFETPGGSDSSPSSPSGPPLGPVKYDFADFPGCLEIQQKLPELKMLDGSPGEDATGSPSRVCSFMPVESGAVVIGFEARLYGGRENADGFQSGAERAKVSFSEHALSEVEEDRGVGVGSAAHWTRFVEGGGCTIQILDENAVITATYYDPPAGDFDPRSEECRGGAREVARKFYAAVQPR